MGRVDVSSLLCRYWIVKAASPQKEGGSLVSARRGLHSIFNGPDIALSFASLCMCIWCSYLHRDSMTEVVQEWALGKLFSTVKSDCFYVVP